MNSTSTTVKLSAALGTFAIIFTACDSPGADTQKVRPSPKGDEVVVIGGDGTDGDPKSGVFSTRTPLASPSAMAFSANDDALFVAADTNLRAAIVRIGSDGRTSTLETDLPSPIRSLEANSGEIWSLWPTPARDSASDSALYRQSLSGGDPVELFGGFGTKVALTQVEKNNKRLPNTTQKELTHTWYPVGLFAPPQGAPIVALTDGRLFEGLGKSHVRQFIPAGYSSAVQTAGGKSFSPLAVTSDLNGGFVVIGSSGAVWVSAQNAATGVRFRTEIPPTEYKGWYRELGATALGNGDLLISSLGRLYRIKKDGTVSQIKTGSTVKCGLTKKLADFGVPRRTRLARMANGTVAMSAIEQCNRVYAFKLPSS